MVKKRKREEEEEKKMMIHQEVKSKFLKVIHQMIYQG
jgi:hypothetical protein